MDAIERELPTLRVVALRRGETPLQIAPSAQLVVEPEDVLVVVGERAPLLDLATRIHQAPLERTRPLWEFTVVDGLEDGRAAMVQKMHHTITDGVGGVRLAERLVDLERDPEPADAPSAGAEGRLRAESPRARRSRSWSPWRGCWGSGWGGVCFGSPTVLLLPKEAEYFFKDHRVRLHGEEVGAHEEFTEADFVVSLLLDF